MVSRSERPTTPPSFDVVQYAKDSDARMASTRPLVAPELGGTDDDEFARQSETRLVLRTGEAIATEDDAWARAMLGAPVVVMPTDELRRLPLDHRAGFLLSLMDGSMDLEVLVEVSPLARADALRLVRHLFESGVVVFR
jgi:hypothetical protein